MSHEDLTLTHALTSALMEGRLTDPFVFLGPHEAGDDTVVRTFQPRAVSVSALQKGAAPSPLEEVAPGVFAGRLKGKGGYRLSIDWGGTTQETEDPYAFGLLLGDLDLHLFMEGAHWELGQRMGAQPQTLEGVEGVGFSVWAPNARRVSVVGDFNSWDGRRHPMRLRHPAGVWELFVPRLRPGERYKYELVGAAGELLPLKADPLARMTELPPGQSSIVAPAAAFNWTDSDWMADRGRRQKPDAPMSIYEVHAASWLRPDDGESPNLDWDGLADRLAPYVADLGFTHVELLPIMEHPFGGSWGYQPLSQFAPSARYGSPEGLARFVDACHRLGVGVILDWVPAHFPTDTHGLASFDGTQLYEHADPREGFHQDWNTLIFNLGRREVQGFLIASALYWLETFHIDGLRVDAVASMLYRDYSRQPGEWVPNEHGGRENLESIAFLRRLNETVASRCPGAVTIAEESTAWPGVSSPVAEGGLGFNYKWNMGWMHDTLTYMQRDPVYRNWHQNELTFGLLYAFTERFVLPISHDEVVHGKGSLLGKMPGDRWRQFANLRAYLAFMWAHPGKKLLFMGCELAQPSEWNHDGAIPWELLEQPDHAGMQMLVRDLNLIYGREAALHQSDADPEGFAWICTDAEAGVFAFRRQAGRDAPPLIFAVNMTPEPQRDYRLGAPAAGVWAEVLNTDAARYGGGNIGNGGAVHTEPAQAHGLAASLQLTIPPLGAVILRHQGTAA
ncbi:1,4-alpha-glucan branching protein GlgB [Phenylobacterium sp.]|uniref:1,4-alpha-glucan branching protein GlgB n=1 Tax=Phenylobacterium sp. TaxID=1871053 RepID=UPI0027319B34|nr:1,4-alpha-glucan branching protein GlgB [Phenylobacterium sp.]MDP1619277.1 1,4-alpha-glucan branching protein GlgB [Phenylobacterium sp.]